MADGGVVGETTLGGKAMSSLARFQASMDYGSLDRVPNYELGVWQQTRQRWVGEGLGPEELTWDWFVGEAALDLDHREYIPVNFGMIPSFPVEVLERTDRYEIVRNSRGIVTKALIEGTVGGQRMCMDQYISFPVSTRADFARLRRRYQAAEPKRFPAWQEEVKRWERRDHPLILGRNCAAAGFYWRAREWMGTENLCYAWYDQPVLMEEMMEFYADFTMEVCRPILRQVQVDYFNLNEDFAMKSGPLLSPDTFRRFIYPHLCRLVSFLKSLGVTYVVVDSDGNCEPLIPLLMDAGVDCIWPLERAAAMDPARLRHQFGQGLRLWGGVDKRVLATTKEGIAKHLAELLPLIEEGGFIPHVDHTVPPDVPLDNFLFYMEAKQRLLMGLHPR